MNYFEKISDTKPVEIKLHGTDSSTKLWRYWMTQEPTDFNLLLGNGKRLNPIVELAKKLVGKSDYSMAAIFSLIDDILPKENADKIKEITRKCDEELTVRHFIYNFNYFSSNNIILYLWFRIFLVMMVYFYIIV